MESHPLRLPRSMSSTLTRWWLFVSLACPHIPSEISKTITGNQESVSRCDVQLFPWTRFRLALTNDQRLRRQLLRWLRQPSLVRVSFSQYSGLNTLGSQKMFIIDTVLLNFKAMYNPPTPDSQCVWRFTREAIFMLTIYLIPVVHHSHIWVRPPEPTRWTSWPVSCHHPASLEFITHNIPATGSHFSDKHSHG